MGRGQRKEKANVERGAHSPVNLVVPLAQKGGRSRHPFTHGWESQSGAVKKQNGEGSHCEEEREMKS